MMTSFRFVLLGVTARIAQSQHGDDPRTYTNEHESENEGQTQEGTPRLV